MDLKIYDGQYGKMMYPKTDEENILIKKFFNEKLDLYIDKEGKYITIYCKIYALVTKKDETRTEALYIIYKDEYADNSFSRFEYETAKILGKLGHKIIDNKTQNIIYKDIKKFDIKIDVDDRPDSSKIVLYQETVLPKNYDDIKYLLKHGEHIELKTGKINDIITFYKNIVRHFVNISIAIFTGDILANESSINIFLDKNPEIQFSLTDKTKKILDDHAKELEKNRKNEIKQNAKIETMHRFDSTINGLTAVIQGIRNMKNAGCDESEIEKVILSKKNDVMDKFKSIGIDQKTGIDTITIGMTILATLVVGIVIGMIAQPYLQGSFMKDSNIDQGDEKNTLPTNTSPNITVTAIPITIINKTATPNGTDKVDNTNNITNNTNKTNKTGTQ